MNVAASASLRETLAADPGVIIEKAAKDHGVTLRAVVDALPAEMRKFAPGEAFIDVMGEVAKWGDVTVIIHTEDGVMEFSGPVPEGKVGQGYYNLGGSKGRKEATGRGLMFAMREALKTMPNIPSRARIVVQGAGNVGGIGALLLHREGHKIVSISDERGVIADEKGLDMPAVMAWLEEQSRVPKDKRKFLDSYPAQHISGKEQLELDCDVLAPCAVENQITSENVDRIRARLNELSARLGDADWLDGAFSAADILMVHVLQRLAGSGLLDEFPNLSAYVARAEARPAFKRAFAAQLAVFNGKAAAG